MADQEQYMRRALELAERGKGAVAPNPMVGAVLVFEDRVIGEGWHKQYGEAHAEINCLDSVREEDRHLIRRSTMYVTLEPCAHHGKTPPCALRLVEEGVKEVVVCNEDPFEEVQGRGGRILTGADISVRSGVLENHGRWLNRRFFSFHERQRPYIILKWAQTQQGFFAPSDRSRFQMSNASSHQLVHRWRTEEQSILVGTHTALSDDPQLTARYWQGRQPLRIVLDRELKLPASLRLFGPESRTWIINQNREEERGHLSWKKLVFGEALLPDLLQLLHEDGQLSLVVEGGARVLGSFIQSGLWDEARVFTTGAIIQDGVPAPLLINALHHSGIDIARDRLDLYTSQSNPYSFVPGMSL